MPFFVFGAFLLIFTGLFLFFAHGKNHPSWQPTK
jgi:hypothetical protein